MTQPRDEMPVATPSVADLFGRYLREQTAAQIQAMLREFFGRMESPERKAFYDAYIDQTTKYILTAIRMATPAQKAHAQQRMQGWIQDFQVLAAGN